MVLTNERAEMLGKYLTENKERAVALLELSPEEATAKINAEGHDFTVDEVREFGEQLQKAATNSGELDAASLEQVSGGLMVETAVAMTCLKCIAVGVTLGIAAGSNWKW